MIELHKWSIIFVRDIDAHNLGLIQLTHYLEATRENAEWLDSERCRISLDRDEVRICVLVCHGGRIGLWVSPAEGTI